MEEEEERENQNLFVLFSPLICDNCDLVLFL